MKIINFFIILYFCNIVNIHAFFDREDENRLYRAASSIQRETLFTKKSENPLVKNCSSYFKQVRNFDGLLVEIQNFPICISPLKADPKDKIVELIFADFIFQLFAGNVPGWAINSQLMVIETQVNKSVHALACAGHYAGQVQSIDEKVSSLTPNRDDPALKGHFALYDEAYTAGKTGELKDNTPTKAIMSEVYLGNTSSLNTYFNYMRKVGRLRAIQGWWIGKDISFAWTNAPKFLTKKTDR